MNRRTRLPITTDRLEVILAVIILIGLYAATIGILRVCVSLGLYVS
ncbi:hypothetical protein [Rhodococcus wratislaviensis]|nr:hypothetical protein [Rhodococcus wratislaviensis]